MNASRLIAELGNPTSRRLIGIVGVAGSGKSTLANAIATSRDDAVVLAMDGFHLPNVVLERRGLMARKGSPASFDAKAFVDCVQRVRDQRPSDEPIGIPTYSRQLHEPVADALWVQPQTRIVIVEGNYLLLEDEPWGRIAPILDETWFIDIDTELALERAYARHIATGRTPEQARVKIDTNDRPNAELIQATRHRATWMVQPG